MLQRLSRFRSLPLVLHLLEVHAPALAVGAQLLVMLFHAQGVFALVDFALFLWGLVEAFRAELEHWEAAT